MQNSTRQRRFGCGCDNEDDCLCCDVLGCNWDVLGCIGLYGTALGCNGLYWIVLVCAGMYWDVLCTQPEMFIIIRKAFVWTI